MSKPAVTAAAVGVLLIALAGCESNPRATTPSPTTTATATEPPDVSEYQSGPESPIAYGLQVPSGAAQLGPLLRYRSEALLDAYQPELKAATAQKEAEDADKAAKAEAEAEAEGTPLPSTLPTPDTRPSDDSYKLLEDPPKPDTTVSIMRVDGKPSVVVIQMLNQIKALLPNAGVVTDDLSTYCRAVNRRISSCNFDLTGTTTDDRALRVSLTVDPGNIKTRTSPPSNRTRPAMVLTIQYVGEPRKGQLDRGSNTLENVAKEGADLSGLIWPKMDEDGPANTPLVNGWTAPSGADILLSGFRPKFVAMTTQRAIEADTIAEQFAVNSSAKGKFTKDVVEDLNEVITTYTSIAKDGSIARAIYVLSARGNYTALFYSPPPKN